MPLEKLKITAYEKPDYSGAAAGDFTVLINPESFRRDIEIDYADQQALGSSGVELRFKQIPRETVSFKLIFDGTGLVSTAPRSMFLGNQIKPVPQQIKEFQSVISNYSGSIHRPYYLQLSWGKFLFNGVLTSLSITYKLFKPDGTPIRAEADVTFSSSVPPKKRKAKDNDQSPDVSHIKQVTSGDRLPALSNEVYDNPNYFVQVAKKNNLNNLRRLKPGTTLWFPPVTNK